MSGEKTLPQNSFKQWELELYCMLTRLSVNLLKLEHHAGLKQNWADE